MNTCNTCKGRGGYGHPSTPVMCPDCNGAGRIATHPATHVVGVMGGRLMDTCAAHAGTALSNFARVGVNAWATTPAPAGAECDLCHREAQA